MRKLRVVWASLALVALSLAACSALFTAWTWRQTRDLSQSFKILQDRMEQVCIKNQSSLQPPLPLLLLPPTPPIPLLPL